MAWYIPEDLPLYNWGLKWQVPVITSLVYAVIVTIISRYNVSKAASSKKTTIANSKTHKKVSEPWTLFRISVVLHNILLMVFSGVVFMSVIPMLITSFRTRPIYDAFCDVGGWVYRHGIGFWTWIFYMSKYYELLDTAILLAKGRPSSFLQTYHHAGAIMTMWMLSSTRAFGAWIFVAFNSFIHTLMYLYYTLTCFGLQPKWKRLMTYMQITQFLVGLPTALTYILVPGCLPTVAHPKDDLARVLGVNGYWSHVIMLCFGFNYVLYLVFLFLDFARRTYISSHATATATATQSSATGKGGKGKKKE